MADVATDMVCQFVVSTRALVAEKEGKVEKSEIYRHLVHRRLLSLRVESTHQGSRSSWRGGSERAPSRRGGEAFLPCAWPLCVSMPCKATVDVMGGGLMMMVVISWRSSASGTFGGVFPLLLFQSASRHKLSFNIPLIIIR